MHLILHSYSKNPSSKSTLPSMKIPHNIINHLLAILIWTTTANQAKCLKLHFSNFSDASTFKIIGRSGGVSLGALQVTADAEGANITNIAGRVLHKKRFNLHKKKKVSSFNSTFVLNIGHEKNGGGEGLAFILTRDADIPGDSQGQWLGIVNASSNGSSQSNIVAVEFDTKKSFFEDLDDNHVGFDINSVYSAKQVSLNDSGIRIASGNDATVMIIYNGTSKEMSVSLFEGDNTFMSRSLTTILWLVDLSKYLPGKVYVGFSASTGTGTELNCVKKWYFDGDDIDDELPQWMLILIPILSLVVFGFAIGAGYSYWRFKLRQEQAKDDDFNIKGIETGLGPKKFKLKDLKAATCNFNPKNELGRGGFGVVYKGLWGITEVAVKRIVNTPQGKQNLVAEVTTIGSVHHKNILTLLGWCYESNELLLVYEYMPNGSLDMLFDSQSENLSWERRHGIICGVAQAVDYLHHECSKRVLHRDIKASNIMLDSQFNPRLGDFGLARMFKLEEKTHHSTKEIVGTPGYMAPEIFHMGRTTAETDVYAFGILALVVASGRNPGNKNNNKDIVDWIWGLYKLNMVDNAIDPKLKGEFNKIQAEIMLVLGLACCHPNPYARPSMRNALQVLMGEVAPPSIPIEKPAFIWPIGMPSLIELEHSFDGEEEDDDNAHF